MTEPAPQPQRGTRPGDFTTSSESRESEWPCWVVSRVDGLNIRDRATADSESNGHLDTGQSILASCRAVSGGQYRSCGGSHGHVWTGLHLKNLRSPSARMLSNAETL
jgi:hypothetical protein